MTKRSLFTLLCLVGGLAVAAAPARAVGLSDVVNTLETPFQAKTAAEFRINDYAADFFQESKIASLDRLQRANGRVEVAFDYQRERTVPEVRFRWQYDQPTTQELVSDGKTLWVYLPENNQVIQSDIERVNEARDNDPMTFLTGLGNLSRDFQISWAVPNRDGEDNYVLEMTPRRSSALISRMVIVVDRSAVDAYLARGQTEPSPRDALPMPMPMPTPSSQPGGGLAFPGFADGAEGLWFPILSTMVYDPNGNSTIIEFSNLRVNQGLSAMSFNFILPAGVQVVRPTGEGMGY